MNAMSTVELNLKSGKSGAWEVKRFTVTPEGAQFHNLRETINGRSRFIYAGDYFGLYRDGRVIMSNTPAEIDDHSCFMRKAYGKVLVGGLGLGMVLKCLLEKETVTKVTVVEKSSDVINLVASAYSDDPRVEIIHSDIFEYKPIERYDCAWFDIWDEISGNEYPEMKKLHRRFGRYVDWSDSWCRKKSKELYTKKK